MPQQPLDPIVAPLQEVVSRLESELAELDAKRKEKKAELKHAHQVMRLVANERRERKPRQPCPAAQDDQLDAAVADSQAPAKSELSRPMPKQTGRHASGLEDSRRELELRSHRVTVLEDICLHYKEVIRIPVGSHVYVAGEPGSGKTTLLEMILGLARRMGLRMIVFDPEGQFPVDIGVMLVDQLAIVDAPRHLVNPFQPPDGCDIRDWIGRLANLERESSYCSWYSRRGNETFVSSVATSEAVT